MGEWSAVSELLLVLDVGNTNTVVGLFQGSDLISRWRLSTHADRTADEVGMWLRQLLDWQGVDPAELVGVAVGSVVPPIDPWLREGIGRYLGVAPFFVEPGIRTGMPLRVDAPLELGADRLCDAVAAHERATEWFERYSMVGGMPSIVADDVAGVEPGEIRARQRALVSAYREDFARYAARRRSELIAKTWPMNGRAVRSPRSRPTPTDASCV
jgi:hypothetical protein